MAVILNWLQQCTAYLRTVRITDMIDMAVLAYLLYRLLLWARNSNVGQILKGIVLIFVMLWATSAFHLNVLNYLLSKVLELGLMAVIIVFHPEIRHFLEQFGSRGMQVVFSRQSADGVDESEAAIDQLVEAYASMSKNKVGALTVFERGTILDDCIKSGTMLDAGVSSELLKNIFWPKAPLHDGAVIIRNGRIVGGGCVLPLSSNTNISRELGTRHRAGIGVTEHTDAVVAICSEETGSISVAVGGMLKRHLAPETLRRVLRNELLPSELGQQDGDQKNRLTGLVRTLNSVSLTELIRGKKEEDGDAQ